MSDDNSDDSEIANPCPVCGAGGYSKRDGCSECRHYNEDAAAQRRKDRRDRHFRETNPRRQRRF